MLRSAAAAAVAGATLVLMAPLPSLGAGAPGFWTVWRIAAALALLGLPLLIAVGRASLRGRRALPPALATALPSLFAALLGATMAIGEVGARSATRWPAELAGETRIITGRVVAPAVAIGAAAGEVDTGGSVQGLSRPVRFDLAVERVECPGDAAADAAACATDLRPPQRLRVTSWPGRGRQTLDAGSGERWRLRLRLQPPDGRLNRGGFDHERWLFLERIDASATVAGAAERLAPAPRIGRGALGAVREGLSRALRGTVTDTVDATLIERLALGLRAPLDPAWEERLQASGTAHLLAISGLHVGLVFLMVRWLAGRAGAARLRLRARGRDEDDVRVEAPRRWLDADVLALLAAALYAALAGFALPAQRALAMLVVGVAIQRRRRVVAPGSTLAAAAGVVLLLDPVAPLSIGFWLSAGAVAAIVALQTGRAAAVTRGARFKGLIELQVWLGALLLPVTALGFQQASLVGPVANLVAIPLIGFVTVPAALLATALAPFGLAAPLAGVCASVAAASLALLERWLDALLALPGAAWELALPGAFAMLPVLLAVALLRLPLGAGLRLPLAGLAALLVLPAALHVGLGRRVDGAELHLLDVGHGLAAIVLTERHTLLFDTGGGLPGTTRAERDVLPYLRALGRPRLDRLILSHADNDHAAGLVALRERQPELPVQASNVGAAHERLAAAGLDGDGVVPCEAGQGFELDGVRFAFLHPADHDRGDDNHRSCVLLVSVGGRHVLLTGDIEAAAEAHLLERLGPGAVVPLGVLVAPHHGSKTSSSAAFVAAFPARHVVFPAARRSRWGFPHASVRMRYKHEHSVLHVTGITGSLLFELDRGAPPVLRAERWREVQRRLWRPR